MYILGHLGTALIIASLFYIPVAAFLLGVFLPDIVDKSLSVLNIVECGRSNAHNVFFALGAGAIALAVTRKKKIAVAIFLGCIVHLIGDSAHFVPYFYPLVNYDFSHCGPFKLQPGTFEIAMEIVGAILILVWWKFRSKIFYLRDKILRLGRLKRVFA